MLIRRLIPVVVGLSIGAAAWAGGFPLRAIGGDVRSGQEMVVDVTTGPGWQALPPLAVHVVGAPSGDSTRIWVADPREGLWHEITLAGDSGRLPIRVPDMASLWALRFRVLSTVPVQVTVVPTDPLTLTRENQSRGDSAPVFSLTNWGEARPLRVQAVDAAGQSVPMACLNADRPSQEQNGAYVLNGLASGQPAELLILLPSDPQYPVLITATDGLGHSASQPLGNPRIEDASYQPFIYYGLAHAEWDCNGNSLTNATRMVITGIKDSTAFTVTDLSATPPTVLATGTVNRGQEIYIATDGSPSYPLIDGHKYKLTASQPVQAYMGYDCSGTLPGTMFFLSDNGITEYGTSFTVPLANFTDGRLQYWVFSTGAGTVSFKPLAGSSIPDLNFSSAGVQKVALNNDNASSVVYVTSSGPAIAVEQSSQNAATEVPPTSQAAAGCTVANTGTDFYVHVQPWNNKAPYIAVFPYKSGNYSVQYWTGSQWRTSVGSTGISAGQLSYKQLESDAYAYHVVATNGATIGVMAGSIESPNSSTPVYYMGDDAIYLRGNGNEIRGHAMACGGTIFISQDNTTVSGTCTGGGSSCGLPSLPVTQDADSFIDLAGNTFNNTLFDLTTQDAQHPILAEVFGGNCATQLNDWSKVMKPVALGRPVITYPTLNSPLLSQTPLVTGIAVPGATVTLYVSTVRPPSNPIWNNAASPATADAVTGAWSIQVTATLDLNTAYYFDAIQSINGVCSVTSSPTPGSSQSSGSITVTPPTITAPADGSSTYNQTPVFAGTAPAGTTITLTLTGPGGTVTVPGIQVDGGGNWTYTPTSPLAFGSYTVSAVAQDGAGNTSTPSGTNFTIASLPSLLRGYATALSPQTPPNSQIFAQAYPLDPALSPTANLEQPNYPSGGTFPHQTSDLDPVNAPPLVFYELSGNSGDTLRVTKSNGQIVITYGTP